MRVGLAGVGRFGQHWLRIARPEVVLRASDRPIGGALMARDFDDLLERCTHVIIATPAPMHGGMVTAALFRSRHVLCEKPIAWGAIEVEFQMVLAAAYDRPVWVSYPHLYHPAVETMPRRNVDAECAFAGPKPEGMPESQWDPLIEWGPHALSAAVWLLGGDAELDAFQVADDRKRAQVELTSASGRVRCDFGEAPVKRTRIKMNAPERRIYTGEASSPEPLQRLFDRWIAGDEDERSEMHLSLVVHRIIDEVRGA